VYSECHYGLILRQDDPVNHVACPTKLIEYLAYGVVPVVDSPRIGDFLELGMRYVTLADLESGNLPQEEERREMARANYAVFERLREQYQEGCLNLRRALGLPPQPERVQA
jgi:hypothetical protein